MKKNVCIENDKTEILARLEKLHTSAQRKWGKMNVHQAVCHLTDQLRDLDGTRPVAYEGNPFFRYVLRPVISRLNTWPKAKFPTASGYDQMRSGTAPVDFEQDKNVLITKFREFNFSATDKPLPPHPAFGNLSHQQYGRIVYQHFDHHLRQFGL